ncbi:hypothetical protein ACFOPX_00935 [Helicobacter baculiformis]|uniref:Uncharacterized protein n=1 Tax=Helicobacter baculiformis TaxID=427351 RepID=A0ABV7ZGF7_9HELI
MELEATIVHSAINFPEYLEDFLTEVGLKHFERAHVRILECILGLLAAGQSVSLGALRVSLGEEFCTSSAFLNLLQTEIMPDYYNARELLIQEWRLKAQKLLGAELIKSATRGEIFDVEILNKHMGLELRHESKTLSAWIKEITAAPPIERVATGIDFLDQSFKGGLETAT